MEGHWKFLGGGGVLKTKFLEEMYENQLQFSGGRWGCKRKKTFLGGVLIFSGTAQCRHRDNRFYLNIFESFKFSPEPMVRFAFFEGCDFLTVR